MTRFLEGDLKNIANVNWVAMEAKVIVAGLNFVERIRNSLMLLAICIGTENCVEKLINT